MSQNKGLFDHDGFSEDTIERLLTDKFELDLEGGEEPQPPAAEGGDGGDDAAVEADTHRIDLPLKGGPAQKGDAHDDDTGEFPAVLPLQQELGQLRKRVTELEILLGERARDLSRVVEEKEALQEEADRLLAEERERRAEKERLLETQIEQLDVEKNQTEGQLLLLRAEQEQLRGELEGLRRDLEESRTKHDELTEAFEARTREVERERAATTSLEREHAQEIEQLREALRTQQEASDQRERIADEDRRELERRYNEKLEHWEQERQKLGEQLATEEETNRTQKEALEASLLEQETLRARVEEQETALARLGEEQQDLSTSNQELRRMLADMAREHEELKGEHDRLGERRSRQEERIRGMLTLLQEAVSLAEKTREESNS